MVAERESRSKFEATEVSYAEKSVLPLYKALAIALNQARLGEIQISERKDTSTHPYGEDDEMYRIDLLASKDNLPEIKKVFRDAEWTSEFQVLKECYERMDIGILPSVPTNEDPPLPRYDDIIKERLADPLTLCNWKDKDKKRVEAQYWYNQSSHHLESHTKDLLTGTVMLTRILKGLRHPTYLPAYLLEGLLNGVGFIGVAWDDRKFSKICKKHASDLLGELPPLSQKDLPDLLKPAVEKVLDKTVDHSLAPNDISS